MFFSTIHTFTPHSTVPISSSPWLSQLLRRKIHKRRALFHCATLSHNPHDWLCYRTCQNSIVKESRTAKSHFLNNLSLSPRSFWSFVRSLQKIDPPFPISKTKTHSAALILVKLTCSTMVYINYLHKTPPLHHLPHSLIMHLKIYSAPLKLFTI